MKNTIWIRVKILQEKPNEIIGEIIKKEFLTYPDPNIGEIASFIGPYDTSKFSVGQTVIIESGYVPPNERPDTSKIQMKIEQVQLDHLDPVHTDLDLGIMATLLFVIGLIVLLILIFKKKRLRSLTI